MKIIERILAIAEAKDIKQADIAKEIGSRTSVITNWKTRGTTPPAELLPAIAKLLNVSVEFLITGMEHIEPGTVLPKNEQELLDYYRASNSDGQNIISQTACAISKTHPKSAGKSSEYKIG